ncbi:MAG: O-antigen ligase family protein [Acetobacteraceae bacterium]|nr:O-antigen ligase family protein [Acetobacteraceae bacterium]
MSRWASRCFAYFGLSYYSQGVIAALQAAQGDVARTVAGETNLSSTVAQSLILAGLCIAVIRAPDRYWRLCGPLIPVLGVLGFALLSVLWSSDPARSLRRSVALSECVLFGMFLFQAGGLERTVGRVGRVCVTMAVLSLLAYVALPSIGRETASGYEQAMRGVFPQKNSMAECMLLGLCCYAYRLVAAPRWHHGAAALLLIMCLGLGRGASALAVAGVVCLVAVWLRLQGNPLLRAVLLFLVGWSVVAVAVALIVSPQEVFALVGRDASLTGRVPLWQAIWPEILQAPVIGYGYAAFWDANAPAVQMIWRYSGWPAPDAHSSYLDILLQLGAVGLILYMVVWTRLFTAARDALRTGLGSARFVLIYGTTLLLAGLDEGVIPIPNAWTALLPVTLLAMARYRSLYRAAHRIPLPETTSPNHYFP